LPVLNLTPHPIRIYPLDTPARINPDLWTPTLVIGTSGMVARIGEIDLGTQHLRGCPVPVEYIEYRHANGLPPGPKRDTPEWEHPANWYVVSLALALASERHDLLVPYSEVRNLEGTVVGCRLLARPV
jgi:hypothetical protein